MIDMLYVYIYIYVLISQDFKEHMELIGKKNWVSFIWKYFGFLPDDNQKPKTADEAVCKLYYNRKKVKLVSCKRR